MEVYDEEDMLVVFFGRWVGIELNPEWNPDWIDPQRSCLQAASSQSAQFNSTLSQKACCIRVRFVPQAREKQKCREGRRGKGPQGSCETDWSSLSLGFRPR